MLKQILLETIMSENNRTWDFNCIKGSNQGIDETTIRTIRTIIANNVNIQIAIAEISMNRDITHMDDIVAFIGFIDKNDIEGQINSYKWLFRKIFNVKEDNTTIACQVSQPFKETLRAFDRLKEHGQLNKWVSFFILKEPVQDCSEIACYEYTSDKDHDPYEVEQLEQDIFFQYYDLDKKLKA